MAVHSLHVLFCVVFQNFYAILQKFCTLIRVYSGYDLNVLPLGYTSATLRYLPLPAPLWIYDFIWLPCPFSEIINWKRHHIGIRI